MLHQNRATCPCKRLPCLRRRYKENSDKRNQLKKQEGYITDPSRTIKIVLWGNYADHLKQGCTPFFNKLRVKGNADQKYLNTPKQQTECTIQEVEPFKTPLPKLDKISTSKEITARVLGISTLVSTVHAVTAFTR